MFTTKECTNLGHHLVGIYKDANIKAIRTLNLKYLYIAETSSSKKQIDVLFI